MSPLKPHDRFCHPELERVSKVLHAYFGFTLEYLGEQHSSEKDFFLFQDKRTKSTIAIMPSWSEPEVVAHVQRSRAKFKKVTAQSAEKESS